jgi:hypothetical protein
MQLKVDYFTDLKQDKVKHLIITLGRRRILSSLQDLN